MLPAKIEMGARICLGARKYCYQSKESAAGEVGGRNYISGAIFGGFSYQDPTENYLLVMSTEFSIGKILESLAIQWTQHFTIGSAIWLPK